MKPPSGPRKTNPIKACPERSRMGQFPKGQNELKIACQKIWQHPGSRSIGAGLLTDLKILVTVQSGHR